MRHPSSFAQLVFAPLGRPPHSLPFCIFFYWNLEICSGFFLNICIFLFFFVLWPRCIIGKQLHCLPIFLFDARYTLCGTAIRGLLLMFLSAVGVVGIRPKSRGIFLQKLELQASALGKAVEIYFDPFWRAYINPEQLAHSTPKPDYLLPRYKSCWLSNPPDGSQPPRLNVCLFVHLKCFPCQNPQIVTI